MCINRLYIVTDPAGMHGHPCLYQSMEFVGDVYLKPEAFNAYMDVAIVIHLCSSCI